MAKRLTDEDVEREIERLKKSDDVQLALYEQRKKYRHRQKLYQLRWLEKRGKALKEQGITRESFNEEAEFDELFAMEETGE